MIRSGIFRVFRALQNFFTLNIFHIKANLNLKVSDSQIENSNRPPAAAPPSNASLGAQLKAAREAQSISLRSVSDQTRISMRHLEAIEVDDYKQLPGGLFNRSFVKAYAKAVGFSEAQAIEQYTRIARAQGETDDNDHPISYTPQVYTDNSDASRPPLATIFFSFLILAILCYGAYAALHWYRNRTAPPVTPTEAAQSATTANTLVTTPPTPAPPVSDAANQPLTLRVGAFNEDVSVTLKTDNGDSQTINLKAGDPARDFTAQQQISLRYARTRAAALQVEINGRPARVPVSNTASVSELIINRETLPRLTQ